MTELNSFSRTYNLKFQGLNLDQYFTRKLGRRASVFTFTLFWAFCQDLKLQVALTGRKSLFWVKRLPITLLIQITIVNHIKLGSKIFNQQTDVPKRGL